MNACSADSTSLLAASVCAAPLYCSHPCECVCVCAYLLRICIFANLIQAAAFWNSSKYFILDDENELKYWYCATHILNYKFVWERSERGQCNLNFNEIFREKISTSWWKFFSLCCVCTHIQSCNSAWNCWTHEDDRGMQCIRESLMMSENSLWNFSSSSPSSKLMTFFSCVLFGLVRQLSCTFLHVSARQKREKKVESRMKYWLRDLHHCPNLHKHASFIFNLFCCFSIKCSMQFGRGEGDIKRREKKLKRNKKKSFVWCGSIIIMLIAHLTHARFSESDFD